MKNKEKQFISVAELAKMLGISRIAVFKRIKKGQIPAEKVGRSYIILMENVDNVDKIIQGISTKILTEKDKKVIEKSVEKTVKEYGETLRLLGKE